MIHLINLLTQNNNVWQSRKKWECPFHYFSPQSTAGEDLSHLPMEHRGGDILLRESKGPIAQVGYNIKVSFHHFCPIYKIVRQKSQIGNSVVMVSPVQYQSPILCPPHQAQRRPLGGFKRQAVQDDDVWPAKGSDADQPQIQDIQVISHIGTCNLLTMSPRSSARRRA